MTHPPQLHRWVTHLPRSVLACLLAASISACALEELEQEPAEVEEPTEQIQAEVVQLAETVRQKNTRILELELRLLMKQSEIRRLSFAQEQAIQEVVRAKAKLRSRNSKAETVANLAEVKLTLEGAETRGNRVLQSEGLERARQYIAMSEAALEEHNYDGASYLIGQAKSSLLTSAVSSDESSQGNSDTYNFFLPVRMTVTQQCNVRAGPGTDKEVLAQLTSGTPVLAIGYEELWVRIQREGEAAGWVHYSLLDTDQ